MKTLQLVATTRDLHKVNAARIFNVAYEMVTEHQRAIAKQVSIAAIYGNKRAARIMR